MPTSTEILPGQFFDSTDKTASFDCIETISPNLFNNGKVRCIGHKHDGTTQIINVYPHTLTDGHYEQRSYPFGDYPVAADTITLTRNEVFGFAMKAADDLNAIEVAMIEGRNQQFKPGFDKYLTDLIDGFKKACANEGIA